MLGDRVVDLIFLTRVESMIDSACSFYLFFLTTMIQLVLFTMTLSLSFSLSLLSSAGIDDVIYAHSINNIVCLTFNSATIMHQLLLL